MSTELKDKNKQRQKKFKPIKIPTKNNVPPPQAISKKDEVDSSKITENKENKLKSKINTIPHEQKKVRTKQTICYELLKQGYIQSFIDMFYISHKCLPNVMHNKNYFGEVITSSQSQDLNQSDLGFLNQLSNNLKKAQSKSYYNNNDKQSAMNEYNALAYTYQDQGEYITAAYFYNKVIEIAKTAKNKQYEVIAMIGTAKCYDHEKQTQKSIQLFQQSLKQAQQIQNIVENENIVKLISKDLIQIYMKVAQEHQKNDNSYENALIYYQKCLKVAQNAKQHDSQGLICYKIGQLYYKAEQYKKSVQYQQRYLNVIKTHQQQSKNSVEEGKQKNQISIRTKIMEVHAALSKCFLKLKQINNAENHLNQYNMLAKELKIQNALADSSYYLAKLYQQKGNSQKSIEFYRAYFQAAKSQRPQKKDRKLVDKARVTYAIAKGNQNMDKFIKIFNSENSLRQILDYKLKKELK